MPHLSQNELKDLLEKAKKEITIGGRYVHYKTSLHTYIVKDVVIFEATNEPYVVYQAEYGEEITFARAASVWVEKVKWQNSFMPRFKKVN